MAEAVQKGCLVRVPFPNFKNGVNLRFSIFIKPDDNQEPVLYAAKGTDLDEGRLDRLNRSGLENFYVPKSQLNLYFLEMEGNLKECLGNESVSVEQKCRVLGAVVLNMADGLLKGRLDPVRINRTTQVVQTVTDFAVRNTKALTLLRSLTRADKRLVAHSVNTALYSIGMGIQEFPGDIESISLLGTAAILHDIGKVGEDNSDEFEISSDLEHTSKGAAILKESNQPEEFILVAGQHHEREDGSGGPHGLSGDEFHYWAKIVALADIFDHVRRKQEGYLDLFKTFEIVLSSFNGCFSNKVIKLFLASFKYSGETGT